MTDSKKTPSDYEALIEHKEIEILLLRENVRDFLGKKHKAGATKETQALVNEADRDVDNILKSIRIAQTTSSKFKAANKKLCQQCKELRNDIRDMQKWLSDDLAEIRYKQRDTIKDTTFLFGLPATFYIVVNQGLFDKLVSPKHAAGVGLVISSGVLFYKKIVGASRAASRSICRAPEEIKNDFTLFYTKETIKEGLSKAAARAKKIVAKTPFHKKPGF